MDGKSVGVDLNRLPANGYDAGSGHGQQRVSSSAPSFASP